MQEPIEYIAFDADDTLWENEIHFRGQERLFCELMSGYVPADEASRRLFDTEMRNMPVYGYGLKSMTLSVIETICEITGGRGDLAAVDRIVSMARDAMARPLELIDGAEATLRRLRHGSTYRLVLATKGERLEQQNKIDRSGLKHYFDHIEIMNDKTADDYRSLLDALGCPPQRFVMIGNSLRSDILPVLELGGRAIHIPHRLVWAYEHYDGPIDHPNFTSLASISAVPALLGV